MLWASFDNPCLEFQLTSSVLLLLLFCFNNSCELRLGFAQPGSVDDRNPRLDLPAHKRQRKIAAAFSYGLSEVTSPWAFSRYQSPSFLRRPFTFHILSFTCRHPQKGRVGSLGKRHPSLKHSYQRRSQKQSASSLPGRGGSVFVERRSSPAACGCPTSGECDAPRP